MSLKLVTIESQHSYPKESGATAVETAIVLPIVLLLLCAAIQWGLIFSTYVTLVSASASAARLVALANPPLTDNELIVAAKDAAEPLLDRNIVQVTVQNTVAGGGQAVKRIQCSYQLSLLLPFVVPGQSGGTMTVNAQSTGR